MANDKLLHAAVCALICITAAKFLPIWVSGLVALVAGVCKEIYDIRHGVPSWWDLLADVAGIAVGILICLI